MTARVLVVDDSVTITRAVSRMLARRGYLVQTAADGAQALAAAQLVRPDVMLVDFVMPTMNGYELCTKIREDFLLHDVPILLMSAKGDQIGDRFVKAMGITDYLTKPFSADVLTAAVERALAPSRLTSVATRNLTAAPVSEASPAESARMLLLGTLQRADAAHAVDLGAVVDDVMPDLLRALERAANHSILRGDLAKMPLGPILGLLSAQTVNGLLILERDNAGAMIHFRHGRIEQAVPGGNPELALGRFLHRVDDRELSVLLSTQTNTGRLLGEQAIASGRASNPDVATALAAQTRAVLFDALKWRSGTFVLVDEALPPHVAALGLGLEVEHVLLEGLRQVDEWYLIEPVIGSMDCVFLRNEGAIRAIDAATLTSEELRVLECVNGRYSVRELVRKTGLGTFQVSQVLYRLATVQLIRRRISPLALDL